MTAFLSALKKGFKGEFSDDPIYLKIYSVDASIYEVEPQAVVFPKDKADLQFLLQKALEFNISVTARGAATGITGGCLSNGIVIDLSRHMNQILEINYEQEYAICQPGVVQDRLNEALASRDYRLGPETSTGNRATLGGMVANNSAGSHSLHYGCMLDHVLAIETSLIGGRLIHLQALDENAVHEKCHQQDEEGLIYRTVAEIKKNYRDEIEKRFPKIPRRVSGYNLNCLVNDPMVNLSRLFVGSEGTLGIATEIKVKIVKKHQKTSVCLIFFHDMIEAMSHIPLMLEFHPLALEMLDDKIIEMGKLSPATKDKLGWLLGSPKAVFAAEFEQSDQLQAFAEAMKSKAIGYAHRVLTSQVEINHLWDVRKSGLGLLLSKRSYSRAIAFIEDLSIAPDRLAGFMEKFLSYLKRKNKEAGIYGHVGAGCMHIRPYIDLRSPQEMQLMQTMMEDISSLVLEYGGALSGEHGDGLIRSWLNPKMFGEKIIQAFHLVKKAFDPPNLMNPGKVVDGSPVLENLRLSPTTPIKKISTFLDFSREGGFELAADLCNGNGLCRKAETVMCPSFQATNNEYDTTRARAQALRSLIHNRMEGTLASSEIHNVLDLCLECKGCKTECPSQVDMAKMKSEVLYQYHQKHGYPLRSYLFGYIGDIFRWSSPLSSLFNSAGNSHLGKFVLKKLGIAPQRSFPPVAKQSFSKLLAKQPQTQRTKRVVLFNDTYTEFNYPEIGLSAYSILTKLGYSPIVPYWHCCGRPLISKGLLPQAREKAKQLLDVLSPYVKEGLKIIGLEPSCILTIKDDYPGLVADELAHHVANACLTFDEFLNQHMEHGVLSLNFSSTEKNILLHGHCHQKSLVGTKPTIEVLKGVKGFHVAEIPSGCCGAAGSFGYETEHYDLSLKIGELHLLPAIRASSPDTQIVANGVSCRNQIQHGTGRRAFHLAEIINQQLKDGLWMQ